MQGTKVRDRHTALNIALPASLVTDTPHLREKTMRVGLVGRAAAIFNVREVLVYADRHGLADQREDGELVASILSYMETPQYLRRRLFPRVEALKYAGILPPLRTSHHPLGPRFKLLSEGELREALVLESRGGQRLVDVGVGSPIPYRGREPPGRRVTTRIVRREGVLQAEPAPGVARRGYSVRFEDSPLSQVVELFGAELNIATSKHGTPFCSVRDSLTERLREVDNVLVIFGSPREGLSEILGREGLSPERLTSFVINMVPGQGTETVRTEEAVLITLGAMNALC